MDDDASAPSFIVTPGLKAAIVIMVGGPKERWSFFSHKELLKKPITRIRQATRIVPEDLPDGRATLLKLQDIPDCRVLMP